MFFEIFTSLRSHFPKNKMTLTIEANNAPTPNFTFFGLKTIAFKLLMAVINLIKLKLN